MKTGTVMQGAKLGYLDWAIAIYLVTTNLKAVSAMKLHRDLEITQKSAWHLLHRLRTTFELEIRQFSGPVEVDETYIGGKRKNMSNAKRGQLREDGEGRGAVGKTAVVGAKDRDTNKVAARVVESTDKKTLQGFVHEQTEPAAQVYTDDAVA